MQKVNLYRYEEANKVIITPNKRAEADIPSRMRLIADKGYILTDGTTEVTVIDVMLDEVDLWSEVVETTDETNLKAQAYDILMGVSE